MSKVSRQSGKPVIEERLLNQILYNLPQLYELNQDLLRELKQRVAKWYKKKNVTRRHSESSCLIMILFHYYHSIIPPNQFYFINLIANSQQFERNVD